MSHHIHVNEKDVLNCSICSPYGQPLGYSDTPGIGLPVARIQHKQDPDPTVSALDALRQAVVAQTALLRSLSEQVRLGNEAHYAILKANQNLLQGIDTVQDAIRFEAERDRKEARDQIHISRHETIKYFDSQAAGLAERLEKLDQQDDRFLVALEQVANGHRARLAAIEAKLTPPDAERIFTPEELRKLERDFKFKPLRTTRPAPKGAARRKAKR